MNVLIVHKSTNFELHGSRVKPKDSGLPTKSTQDFNMLKAVHDEHYTCLKRLSTLLTASNIEFQTILRGKPWPVHKYDVVITVGGDGTLLWASQQMQAGGQIVGIRSSQTSVGHLCYGGFGELEQIVADLKKGAVEFLAVSRMCARVTDFGQVRQYVTAPVLNDILFANTSPAATSRYSLSFGDLTESQKSSGIWISTAAGSTAAVAAAGGKTLNFTDTKFQFQVRELFRQKGSHYKLVSAIFDPDETPLRIESHNENAIIALDGQHREFPLKFGDVVEILRAPPQMVARPQSCI